MFNAALQDLEGLVTTAKRRQCKRLMAHGVKKSSPAFEDGRGAGESSGGKEDGEDGVAAGVGKGAAFPQGHIANARLIQGQVGDETQVEGLRDLFLGQSHSLGSAQRAGQDAQGDVVKTTITHAYCITETAKHLVGQHRGSDHRLATAVYDLGWGQHSSDSIARVTRFLTGIAVVKV